MSGDITSTQAVVWSRSDRPATMIVEWATDPDFKAVRRVMGPLVSGETDLVGKTLLTGLVPDTRIHYRVRFEGERPSEWLTGSLATPPLDTVADIEFAWSGDTNGQGWGIDESRGGMPAFAAVAARRPDFFISVGDAIYGDDPILPVRPIEGAAPWRNVTTPSKLHAAETLEDFRGAHRYGRHSRQVRELTAHVPYFAIWDDHEVRNNWSPGDLPLAVPARRAFIEYVPTLLSPIAPAPMYRSMRWGPLLEIFFLDGRSFRTLNYPPPPAQAFLGSQQLAWLEGALAASTATWKVVACDMPLSLIVSEPAPGGGESFDAFANHDNGAPLGRELELAHLFAFLKAKRVKNVVWLTADVHYAAAHRYDPSRAAFKDLDPFWEFVAGPMHATAFPRKPFDDTFGPELAYTSADGTTFGSPADGQQFFGMVRIDGKTRALKVTLVDARGRDLYSQDLPAAI